MTSRNSFDCISKSENQTSSEPTREPSIQSQECVLSQAAQKHMLLIGALLVQMIREWNKEHADCAPETASPAKRAPQ